MQLRILVSSAGRRVGLIECFRRAAAELDVSLDVLACDMVPQLSAACQLADRAFGVPHCNDPGFVDAVCDIARNEGVALVVPTIDPELRRLAGAADRFVSFGARVHVSPPEVIDIVRDKLETARVLGAAGLPVPRTAGLAEVRERPGEWAWPLFMKPRSGSASRSLDIVGGPDALPKHVDEPMVLQELLDGPEYTINMFVDMQGNLRSAVPHRRLSVRAGEVEKGRTERHPELAELAHGIVRALPAARGALCFQAILDRERGARIIEINARFGGGYPLADRAGGTFARWLLEEAAGLPLTAHDDWREDVIMLRYDAAVFRG